MKQPIFVFYEIHNFYQNHRRYIKSKSATQLAGDEISLNDAKTACEPVYTNKQMGVKFSWDSKPLNEDDVASPCGLIAKSYFTGKTLKIIKI
jgi:hypothetical protein